MKPTTSNAFLVVMVICVGFITVQLLLIELRQTQQSIDRLTERVKQVTEQLSTWGGVQP